MKITVEKFRTDEKIISIASKDGKIYTGGTAKVFMNRTDNKILYRHDKTIRSIAVCSRFLGCASYDCTAALFENNELFDVIEGPDTEIKCMAFSENEEHLALCTRNGSVWVCTIGSLIEIESILEDHSEDVKGCKFYCDMLFTYGFDCTVRIYQYFDINCTFEQVQCLNTESTIWDIAFNGDRMYVATENGEIIVYELQKGWIHVQTKKVSVLPIYSIGVYKDLLVVPVNIGNVIFLDLNFRMIESIENLHSDFINTIFVDDENGRVLIGSDDSCYSILTF